MLQMLNGHKMIQELFLQEVKINVLLFGKLQKMFDKIFYHKKIIIKFIQLHYFIV